MGQDPPELSANDLGKLFFNTSLRILTRGPQSEPELIRLPRLLLGSLLAPLLVQPPLAVGVVILLG